MKELFNVVVMNVAGIITHRETKYCVCISTSRNKYLLINTEHRAMYDDFEIKAENYSWLNNKNRFIACSVIYSIEPEMMVQTVGKLIIEDIKKIIEKIKKSRTISKIDKNSVLPELEHQGNFVQISNPNET